MKSYLQGMITGVVLVFATMVLVGASVNDIVTFPAAADITVANVAAIVDEP